MEGDAGLCTLVMMEPSRCWIARNLDQDSVLTILGLISEDPANWEEAASVWDRYKTPAVCDHPSALALEESSRLDVMEDLSESGSWVVIDFETKRIFSGGDFEPVGRDASFSMAVDPTSRDKYPLSIHLPPWWELHEEVSLVAIGEPRKVPIQRPLVDRDILYGEVFLRDIALRALDVVAGKQWNVPNGHQRDYHEMTVQVHRDWLMTPRKELGGRMPRELLHGAIDWIDSVTQAQVSRYVEGEKLIAIPSDWPGYATAPMGSQEMCMYFDYCREILRSAWVWCMANDIRIATQDRNENLTGLVDTLRQSGETWMSSSFEDGPSPSFVIECDRRRVPIGDGVQIDGIDGVAKESHVNDCNCPICEMLADGSFGTSFSRIDGHHLELDEEFAFSMAETLDDWDGGDQEFDELCEGFEIKTSVIRSMRIDEPMGSAWVGVTSDRPIPGDRRGHLKMAFMVAEIVSVLEKQSNRKQEIKSLNSAFTEYRKSKGPRVGIATKRLKRLLESLARRYPKLVSKSADLQSYLDESARVF